MDNVDFLSIVLSVCVLIGFVVYIVLSSKWEGKTKKLSQDEKDAYKRYLEAKKEEDAQIEAIRKSYVSRTTSDKKSLTRFLSRTIALRPLQIETIIFCILSLLDLIFYASNNNSDSFGLVYEIFVIGHFGLMAFIMFRRKRLLSFITAFVNVGIVIWFVFIFEDFRYRMIRFDGYSWVVFDILLISLSLFEMLIPALMTKFEE